jgi:hypothetical protein
MLSFTARWSMQFIANASTAARRQTWARFLTALLRALSVPPA